MSIINQNLVFEFQKEMNFLDDDYDFVITDLPDMYVFNPADASLICLAHGYKNNLEKELIKINININVFNIFSAIKKCKNYAWIENCFVPDLLIEIKN